MQEEPYEDEEEKQIPKGSGLKVAIGKEKKKVMLQPEVKSANKKSEKKAEIHESSK